MENCSKVYIEYEYSDGRISLLPIDLDRENSSFSDGTTNATIQLVSAAGGANEYTVTLTANEKRPLQFVSIRFEPEDAFTSGDLRTFLNGMHTNQDVSVKRFSDLKNDVTRDICLMKNMDTHNVLNFAFTSVDRFLAFIHVENEKGRVSLRYHMEGKPLTPGEEYTLERFMVSHTLQSDDFLALYTDKMNARYIPQPKKPLPTGFCSWSMYYYSVDEAKVTKAVNDLKEYFGHKKPTLVQIDDGWQVETTFSGAWTVNEKRFPNGLAPLAKKFNEMGFSSFGLWMAPLLAEENTTFYQEHRDLFLKDVNGQPRPCAQTGCNVYPLDLANPKALDTLAGHYRRAVEEYGASYFKVDFLAFVLRSYIDNSFIIYDSDYSVALFRKALMRIRETVGPDAFMLACIAPIPETAGIFNAVRIGPDIIMPKYKGVPTGWEIVNHCARNAMLRYFYHDKMFINDPDGLVVRDYDNNDVFDVSYHEARLWATAVAMSGGSVLVNEEISRLSPARRELIEQVMLPYGKAASPLDFFELPQPTTAVIEVDASTKLVSRYNWDEKIEDKKLDLAALGFDGDAIVVDCWEKQVLGVFNGNMDIYNMMPHSACVYLVKALPSKPSFLFGNSSLFAGVDIYEADYSDDKLTITANEKLDMCKGKDVYVFVPAGFEIVGDYETVASNGWKVIKTEYVGSTVINFRRS